MAVILEPDTLSAFVVRRLLLLVFALGALAWPSSSPAAATPQELPPFTASDGAKLACALVEPTGTVPAAGWPAVMMFHGLGGRRQDLYPLATLFATKFASLMCDARGHGQSEGLFGLDGPRDVLDTKELFAWLAARPEISDTQIGALGFSLGGGAVWNATVAGVPFKAIVPVITWTNLATALAPQGLSKSGLVSLLATAVPESRWDPELLAAKASLISSTSMATVNALAASRSPISRLSSVTTPTLLIQGRRDFLFDIDQALAAYKVLKGPKRLYLGDLGHPPGISPASAPDVTAYATEAYNWFDHFLNGAPNGIDKRVIELGHDPYDGKATPYTGTPPTKTVSVTLPGTTTITGASGKVVRGARITGGPNETFGVSTVVVRYSGGKSWDRLVAVLAVGRTAITAGGVKLNTAQGTATIKLMNQALRVAAGQKLTLYLSSTSLAQSPANALYLAAVSPGAQITIGRVTLNVSKLKKAVSK
jgi:alpha-beta hydrolase superfamily lysophospholipase